MKNLMKFNLFALLLLLGVNVNAQNFGVQAGVNLADVKSSIGDVDIDTDNALLFNFGLVAEYPITEMLDFKSGLNLTGRGYKLDLLGAENTLALYYLQLPLALQAKADLGTSKIFGFVGPTLEYGLFGKIKTDVDGQDDTTFKWKDDTDANRFGIGAQIGAGVEFSGIRFSLGYDFGFTSFQDIEANDFQDEQNSKFRTLFFSLGYMFGGSDGAY